MKCARNLFWLAAALSSSAHASTAMPEAVNDNLAKSVMVAVKSGRSLAPDFIAEVPAKEIDNLAALAACKPMDFNKLKRGRYAIIWQCAKAPRGLLLNITDGKLISVEVTDVERRPNREF